MARTVSPSAARWSVWSCCSRKPTYNRTSIELKAPYPFLGHRSFGPSLSLAGCPLLPLPLFLLTRSPPRVCVCVCVSFFFFHKTSRSNRSPCFSVPCLSVCLSCLFVCLFVCLPPGSPCLVSSPSALPLRLCGRTDGRTFRYMDGVCVIWMHATGRARWAS